MKKLINAELLLHLDPSGVLSEQQYECQRNLSTADLSVYLSHPWSLFVEKFRKALPIVLGFLKALQIVSRASSTNYHSLQIAQIYFQLRIKGDCTSLLTNAGVSRGYMLSTKLFQFYINNFYTIPFLTIYYVSAMLLYSLLSKMSNRLLISNNFCQETSRFF